jgi:quinol monooxygenase YgiN
MIITSILDLHVKPEDAAGTPAVLRNVLTATRNFDGNLGVEVFLDTEDPTHFLLVERWESMEADTADGASLLGKMLAGPPTLTKLTLTDI